MSKKSITTKRLELLADVAEAYYVQGKTQATISEEVGVTRSMVSRLLTEAKNEGVIEISVIHPIITDEKISKKLKQRFGLQNAVVFEPGTNDLPRKKIGQITANTAKNYLTPNMIVGIVFGKTIRDTINAFDAISPLNTKILQLVGGVDSINSAFDAHDMVKNFANKTGGTPYYINAPFIVKTKETATELIENSSNQSVFNLIDECNLILCGIGSIHKKFSTFYEAGFINQSDLLTLKNEKAVGGMCGFHFDIKGNIVGKDIEERIIGIRSKKIKKKSTKSIVSAFGENKIAPILGALRTGLVDILVTDVDTAKSVLSMDKTNKNRN